MNVHVSQSTKIGTTHTCTWQCDRYDDYYRPY